MITEVDVLTSTKDLYIDYIGFVFSENNVPIIRVKYKSNHPAGYDFINWVMDKYKTGNEKSNRVRTNIL